MASGRAAIVRDPGLCSLSSWSRFYMCSPAVGAEQVAGADCLELISVHCIVIVVIVYLNLALESNPVLYVGYIIGFECKANDSRRSLGSY